MVGTGEGHQTCLFCPAGGGELLLVRSAQLGLGHEGKIHSGSFSAEVTHRLPGSSRRRWRPRTESRIRRSSSGLVRRLLGTVPGSMIGMSPQTAVIVGALLLAAFLVVIAAMVWQEAQRRSDSGYLVYSVDDAVDFALADLDEDVRGRLGKAGVRRILEWEVYYLQGLADRKHAREVTVVAGGHEPAVAYIAGQISGRHGVSYDLADVREVLAGEARYLAAIGAVGEAVEEAP